MLGSRDSRFEDCAIGFVFGKTWLLGELMGKGVGMVGCSRIRLTGWIGWMGSWSIECVVGDRTIISAVEMLGSE